jgi:hypothetical protein
MQAAKTRLHARYLRGKQQAPNGFAGTSYKLFSKARQLGIVLLKEEGHCYFLQI